MKEIKAYIRTNKTEDVLQELERIGICGLTLVNVMGMGNLSDEHQSQYSIEFLERFTRISKLEIICRQERVDEIIKAIQKKAYTGFPGDGYIFVSDVERAIKIRTGKEGKETL